MKAMHFKMVIENIIKEVGEDGEIQMINKEGEFVDLEFYTSFELIEDKIVKKGVTIHPKGKI